MTDWQIPGVAVCVVKDGKVVVMKCYGVKEMGTNNKVDENTLFMIGSNSKAFTGTALAMLAADKKISLDSPVIKYLPDFKLYDPWVTKQANVRDLLCIAWDLKPSRVKEWPFTTANGKVKSVVVAVADFVEFLPYEFYRK